MMSPAGQNKTKKNRWEIFMGKKEDTRRMQMMGTFSNYFEQPIASGW